MKRLFCFCANSGPKMPIFCILVAIFLLVSAQFSLGYESEIDRLSTSMAEKISRSGKKTIAVVDFTDLQGNVTELGRFLAEEFSAALANAGKGFEVIDRVHLKSILKEHKLSESGLIDPATARKLGKIAGVGALVTGTITPFGERVRLSAKVLDTDSAKVICASRGNIPKTDAIEELLGKGIETPAGVLERRSSMEAERQPQGRGPIRKVESNNFIFEFLTCKMSGKNVACNLLITNKGEDRELEILSKSSRGPASRIFDDLGNIYGSEVIQFGNKKGRHAKVLTISNIPIKATIHFNNVSPRTTKIGLLELSCYSRKDKQEFRPQIRDIPLLQK